MDKVYTHINIPKHRWTLTHSHFTLANAHIVRKLHALTPHTEDVNAHAHTNKAHAVAVNIKCIHTKHQGGTHT